MQKMPVWRAFLIVLLLGVATRRLVGCVGSHLLAILWLYLSNKLSGTNCIVRISCVVTLESNHTSV